LTNPEIQGDAVTVELNKKIVVVGAGQMGAGIAQVAAGAGCAVSLADVSVEAAQAGKAKIEKTLSRLVEKGKFEAAAVLELLGRIQPVDSLQAAAEADFVIEAASEDESIKRSIFSEMEKHAGPSTILASNTSSISIAKMASVTSRPDKVVGIHFMNPVPLMELVELVRSDETSQATYQAARLFVRALGKTVITSQDRPGFLVNRVLIPFLNEACFCFAEGVGTAEDIDLGAKLGRNHPMGPLALSDLIGLDTVLSIAQVLHRDFGDEKYRPAPILEQYVEKGWLGRKTGRGFYEYQ
jgi:3-hydroxybutyryl-CoA dehydrogenase